MHMLSNPSKKNVQSSQQISLEKYFTGDNLKLAQELISIIKTIIQSKNENKDLELQKKVAKFMNLNRIGWQVGFNICLYLRDAFFINPDVFTLTTLLSKSNVDLETAISLIKGFKKEFETEKNPINPNVVTLNTLLSKSNVDLETAISLIKGFKKEFETEKNPINPNVVTLTTLLTNSLKNGRENSYKMVFYLKTIKQLNIIIANFGLILEKCLDDGIFACSYLSLLFLSGQVAKGLDMSMKVMNENSKNWGKDEKGKIDQIEKNRLIKKYILILMCFFLNPENEKEGGLKNHPIRIILQTLLDKEWEHYVKLAEKYKYLYWNIIDEVILKNSAEERLMRMSNSAKVMTLGARAVNRDALRIVTR